MAVSLPNVDVDILSLKVMILSNGRPLGVTTFYMSQYTHLGGCEGQKDNFPESVLTFYNVGSGN